MRRRDADRSSPTGKTAAHTSVAPASKSASISRSHGGFVADDRGVGRARCVADVEDAAVVRQRPVVGEARRRRVREPLRRRRARRQEDRRRCEAAVDPAAVAAASISGSDVSFDRLCVGHPQDRAVGQLAGDTKQAWCECGHHDAHRLRRSLERSGRSLGSARRDDSRLRRAEWCSAPSRTPRCAHRRGRTKARTPLRSRARWDGPTPRVSPARSIAAAVEAARLAWRTG